MQVLKPSNLLATRAEIEAARNGSDPVLAQRYIDALEKIAEAALGFFNAVEAEACSDEPEFDNVMDWTERDVLQDALRDVYCI